MAIRDPGLYRIYAWPEHNECDQWNDAQVQCESISDESQLIRSRSQACDQWDAALAQSDW